MKVINWDRFIKSTRPLFYSIIYNIVKDTHKTEDLLQDTYLSLFENCKEYDNLRSVGSKIAFNKAITSYRKERSADKYLKITEHETCENTYEDSQYIDELLKMINTDTCSKALERYISGYLYKEIAKEMNLPLGTVKSMIHLARKKARSLRDQI